MTPCTFCQILAGELPSSLVLEDTLVVAILDICPWNPGHTLVMPRRHVEFFTDLTQTEVEHLALAGQRVAAALKRGFDSCEAVTFSLADGAAAGQDCRTVICTLSRDGLAMASDGGRLAP